MSLPTYHAQVPDPSECIEQAYFFRTFRERLEANFPAQEVLGRMPEELLTTTRLPMAVQFLATELRHTGLLATGFARLDHYFTPFQAFVVGQSEEEKQRLTITTALLILEQEARYKAGTPAPAGLFVYQFEAISRNRLGYDEGLGAMARDPFYGPEWREYIDVVRRQVGVVEFADLVYLRSTEYVIDQRRSDSRYEPPVPPLFGDKEGKIAKASRGRDPLFLFSALQRQLNYPEVPRPRPRDDLGSQVETLKVRMKALESRLRMVESESRGTFDPTQFGKPELFREIKDEE
jgi:hypothetical protein